MLLLVLCLQVWDNAYPTTCVCLRAYRTSDYFAFADVYLSYFDIGLGLPRKFHTMAFSFCLAIPFSFRVATLFAVSYYYFGYSLHTKRVLLLWVSLALTLKAIHYVGYRFLCFVMLSLVAEKLIRAQPCYQCYLMLMCQSACSCRVARRLVLLLWWAIVRVYMLGILTESSLSTFLYPIAK